jgi:hypothetical protein
MHTSRLGRVLLFIISIGAPGLVFSQADSDATAGPGGFTFVNSTGSTVQSIYLSPVRKHDWGFDRLGEKTLPDGASRFFKVPARKNCGFDLKVVFEGDTPSAEFPKINLCSITKLTLQYDRRARKVSYTTE